MPKNRPPRLELSFPRIVAGALAAASAAVASSWLGVAGTVLGAVVVSFVATVGTALYAHSLERSRYAIQESLPVLASRQRLDREPSDGPETLMISASTGSPVGPQARRRISWSTVAVSCIATLVLGLGLLTGFEGVVGKSAAELTGSGSNSGTTVGSLLDGGRGGTTPSRPTPPTQPPASTSPTTTPTTTEPSAPATTGPTTEPTSPTTTGPTTTDPTTTEPTATDPTPPTTTGPPTP